MSTTGPSEALDIGRQSSVCVGNIAASTATTKPAEGPVASTGTTTTTAMSHQRTQPQHIAIAPTTHIAPHPQYPAVSFPVQLQGHPFQMIQPSLGFAVPVSYHFACNQPSETPLAFESLKKRSGKWTAEEEVYADLLIELFEKGHIQEKNGCTLRSFLAKKLHCAPMRISKKYAGKGIGKMVFLSKTNITGFDGIGSPTYNENMQRLKEAETNFFKVVFPEMGLSFPQAASNSTSTPQDVSNFRNNGLAPLIPAPPLSSTNQPPQSFITPQVNYHLWPTNSQPQTGSAIQVVTAPPPMPNETPAHPVHSQPGTASTTSSSVASKQAESLHQAYLAAANTGQQAEGAQNGKAQKPAGQPPSKGISAAEQLEQAYANAMGDSSELSQTNQTLAAKPQDSATPTPSVTLPSQHQTNNVEGFPNASDIPDFLSGFDKVAKNSTATDGEANSASNRATSCSPTYTSRSFDDFHRMLGKGLSPMEQRDNFASAGSGVTSHNLPSFPNPATTTTGAPTQVPPVAPQLSQGTFAYATNQNNLSMATVQHTHQPPQPRTVQYHHIHSHLLGRTYSDALTGSNNNNSDLSSNLGADSYNIFAQQSALEASKHSAYMTSSSRGGMDLFPRAPLHAPVPRMNAATTMTHINNFRNPHLVSEPSNASDQGTEESDDTTPADSDGTNSESSRPKKARTSYKMYAAREQQHNSQG